MSEPTLDELIAISPLGVIDRMLVEQIGPGGWRARAIDQHNKGGSMLLGATPDQMARQVARIAAARRMKVVHFPEMMLGDDPEVWVIVRDPDAGPPADA